MNLGNGNNFIYIFHFFPFFLNIQREEKYQICVIIKNILQWQWHKSVQKTLSGKRENRKMTIYFK